MSKAISFNGPVGVAIYRATAIAHGLRFYVKTGMKINAAYTPSNMMRVASEITGQKFKARDYLGAADALKAHAEALNAANPDAVT